MTPVEIIGLVSAVITFIDFAAENVAVAWEIQKSGSAAVKGNEDLERRIKLLDDQIASLHRTTPGATRDDHEAELLKLLDEYKDLTVNLLSLLGGLKSTKKRHVLWKSAKNFLKKGEKESLTQDLDNCRARIHLQLTQVMRLVHFAPWNKFEYGLLTRPHRHDLGRRLDNISDQGEQQIAELKTLRQSTEALETKMKSWEHMPDVLEEVRSLVAQVNGALSRKAQRRILKSLWVEGMVDRFEEVEEAHEATFEWIVDHDQLLEDETPEESAARQQMVDWLTRGHGIFHITGKPGAGKSTLMKFLCQSPKTLDYLNTWSGEKSLVISNFFFWRLGTKVQKSLEGLRRSLLYSILERLPDLIPTVFPELWKSAFDDRVMTIRASDIDTALERLLSQGNFLSSHKLVFFIDGLDEFDGDHDKMMKVLLRWTRTYPDDVKFCVSSREWEIFTRRLASSPNIKLHEVTQRDIERFVDCELHEDEGFLDSFDTRSRFSSLVDMITEKAEGVFLWVSITLRGLKWSLAPDDDVATIEERLNSLPNELDALFQSIFDSIRGIGHGTQSDRRSTMRLLLTVMSYSHELGHSEYSGPIEWQRSLVIFYSFLDNYETDTDFAYKLPIRAIEALALEERLEKTRRAIYRQCLGLIDIYESYHDDRPRWFEDENLFGNLLDATPNDTYINDEIEGNDLSPRDNVIQNPSIYDDDSRHMHFSFHDRAKFHHRFPSRRSVRCIHRSVHEFLHKSHIKSLMRADAEGFNEVDFNLQALLASFKMFRPSIHYVASQLMDQIDFLLGHKYLLMGQIAENRLVTYLQELCVTLERDHSTVTMEFHSFADNRGWPFVTARIRLSLRLAFYLRLTRLGIDGSLQPTPDMEYVYQELLEGRMVKYGDIALSNYLEGIHDILDFTSHPEETMIEIFGLTLEGMTELFEAGLSPNVTAKPRGGLTHWHSWLLELLRVPIPSDASEPFLRLFLKHGADCNIWIKYCSNEAFIWWSGAEDARCVVLNESRAYGLLTVLEPRSRIGSFLADRDGDEGIVTFQEFLNFAYPRCSDELQRFTELNGGLNLPPPLEVWDKCIKSLRPKNIR